MSDEPGRPEWERDSLRKSSSGKLTGSIITDAPWQQRNRKLRRAKSTESDSTGVKGTGFFTRQLRVAPPVEPMECLQKEQSNRGLQGGSR
jgi:hypothetical protein